MQSCHRCTPLPSHSALLRSGIQGGGNSISLWIPAFAGMTPPRTEKLFEYVFPAKRIHGNIIQYYASGKIKSKTKFVKGIKHGKMKVYDKKGEVLKTIKFKNNQQQ